MIMTLDKVREIVSKEKRLAAARFKEYPHSGADLELTIAYDYLITLLLNPAVAAIAKEQEEQPAKTETLRDRMDRISEGRSAQSSIKLGGDRITLEEYRELQDVVNTITEHKQTTTISSRIAEICRKYDIAVKADGVGWIIGEEVGEHE